MFAAYNTQYEKLILIYTTECNNNTVHVVKKLHMDVLNIKLSKIFYSPTNTMGTCGI
jgi:hypothetical protein